MAPRYHKNVAGDFYVEAGCCTMCAVPFESAPGMFTFDDEQCYVSRQPVTAEELDNAIGALGVQELDCIHYAGRDREIVRRLVESGEGTSCDDALKAEFEERLRHIARVRFDAISAASFLDALTAGPRAATGWKGAPRYSFDPRTQEGDTARIGVAWYQDAFHALEVSGPKDGVFVLRLNAPERAGQGFSRLIHAWLTALDGTADIVWMTPDEFVAGRGQPAPY